MSAVNTLIKWPGGKSREIKNVEALIPHFNRYIEPFFGGGAMFFYLRPEKALINDISSNLMDYYTLVKKQDEVFHGYLCAYDGLMSSMINSCGKNYQEIYNAYSSIKDGIKPELSRKMVDFAAGLVINELSSDCLNKIVLDQESFEKQVIYNIAEKIKRTIKNEKTALYSEDDLKENLISGFMSGIYMYFRDVYNDIMLKRKSTPGNEYNIANFYYIREYCYGSMFRYNANGEFNIPYGGMSYNRKSFRSKIDGIFSAETKKAFKGAEISCMDFEEFFSSVELSNDDFIFLDPPYDTDFSDYEGNKFTKNDQKRLADLLKTIKAKFILIIKNTDYIYSLYKDNFNILCYDKEYTYNVRSRNDRKAEHLIITNYSV